MNILDHIRIVPDFPKKGINFYDIMPLLANPSAWSNTIKEMHKQVAQFKPEMIIGVEARGFVVGTALASEMNLPLVLVRKKGKLPGTVLSQNYGLEYGRDTIELQPDLIPPSTRILIVDDLLATGGTLAATFQLANQAGGNVVAAACLIELEGLPGRQTLEDISCPVVTLVSGPG